MILVLPGSPRRLRERVALVRAPLAAVAGRRHDHQEVVVGHVLVDDAVPHVTVDDPVAAGVRAEEDYHLGRDGLADAPSDVWKRLLIVL
ncbi:MAG: hypothetical protein ACYS9X_00095 [Planctomycetota bacterium]